jgi:phosphoribosylanthranilate isomerase
VVTRIKICGVTLPDDAGRVAAAGADLIGLNFWPRSKRYIAPERAPMVAAVARAMAPVQVVGLFVDAEPDEVAEIASAVPLDVIQLHGDESPDDVGRIAAATTQPIWKAIAVASARDLGRLEVWPTDAILLDAPSPQRGGSGKQFDWKLAREARRRYPARKFVLAGGLDPDNVGAAIAQIAPWCVDVATGVEAAPGVKDAHKIAAFVAAVRAADPRPE